MTQIGEPGDSFFIIIDGTVAVRTPVGTEAQLHSGEFFGEMSLLDGEPDAHDPVPSRATSRADGPRDPPWHESDLSLPAQR